MIRRKSDAIKKLEPCTYHAQLTHERRNQMKHAMRQQFHDPGHDPIPCWCCCSDCTDLTWYYPPRKGVPSSEATHSGEPPSMEGNFAG